MIEYLTSEKFFATLIHIIIYISIGMLVYYFVKSMLIKGMHLKLKSSKANPKREKTVTSLLTNVVKYLVIFVVIILILREFGINTTSLLASLGVVGLVVGLALQDTIKDFVSGVFIITDREYEVGDYVTIDGFTGEVISLGLKNTEIKAYTGEIKTINNSSVGSVINYCQSNPLVLVDVNVEYEQNTDKIIKVLNSLIPEISRLPHVKTVEVLGVNELAKDSVIYRMAIETKPMEQFAIKRETLKIIKDKFDKENIKIPYPQIEVHNGQKISTK